MIFFALDGQRKCSRMGNPDFSSDTHSDTPGIREFMPDRDRAGPDLSKDTIYSDRIDSCARPRKHPKLELSSSSEPAELLAPDSPSRQLLSSAAASLLCSRPLLKSETHDSPDHHPSLPRCKTPHESNCLQHSDPILRGESEDDAKPGQHLDDPEQMIKARIVSHPLYPRLLEAHAVCLRESTPHDSHVDLHVIEEQLSKKDEVAAKYTRLLQQDQDESPQVAAGAAAAHDPQHNIDQFMVYYTMVLEAFGKLLQQEMKEQVLEAINGLQSLMDELSSLTGTWPTPKLGNLQNLTIEEENKRNENGDHNEFSFSSLSWTRSYVLDHDSGPLQPSDVELTQLEKTWRELKNELKQKYKSKLLDVRAEILRKRHVGKHPGYTTSILKDWWSSHSKWPYPKEDEKAQMVIDTGLQLKQINNWFINRRKRNWNH